MAQDCNVDGVNNVNEVIRDKHDVDAMLIRNRKHFDVGDENDVNRDIKGKRCRIDLDSISYNIALLTI